MTIRELEILKAALEGDIIRQKQSENKHHPAWESWLVDSEKLLKKVNKRLWNEKLKQEMINNLKEVKSMIIGIDYGVPNKDISMFTVAKRENNTFTIIDFGKLEDFNYQKYIASEHQIIATQEDLEKFKIQFLKEK